MSNSFKVTNITQDPSGREAFNSWTRYLGSNLIKFASLDLPVWDMQADATITVPIAENATNDINPGRYVIRSVVIYDDESKAHFAANVANGLEDCYIASDFRHAIISRVGGGFFDSADYSALTTSRGKLLLGYLT